MGLLDSVLGAVMNNSNASSGEGGLGSLIGMVTNNPQVMQAITGLLGNDGEHGGLGGLIAKFQQAGLGEVVGSWVGKGENLPVSADQISSVLGSEALSGLAAKLGVNPDTAASQLSSILPGLVDKLTPHGEAPQGGLGNAGDLMGMLGSLLKS